MTKTAGAATGGAIGSLAGPLGGAVGGGAGYLVSEMATEDSTAISGELSPEVRAAIDSAMGQHRGFVENLEIQVWAAMRLIGALALFSLLASVGYSLWRKRKASPFYDRIRQLERKLKD